ncbi:trace amine-associated receptor 13c-like [Girardinichthys multiradiatus]|uniref:trace amine-associated receptor 13c-like n=1 Tax=Girardinichthys multiradiatus TaxID=208333 RepID=UPI001FAB789B|nr:trace amine-associated receptor 13c-like [Girardinichthys multiradiatus]
MEIQEKTVLCFPHLFNTSCKKTNLTQSQLVLLHSLLSFISLITVALNLLVIISVSHFRQLQTPTNILLLSLAVPDLFVGLLLMPVEMIRNTTCWFLGELPCVLYNYVSFIITFASVVNMVLISVDRYIAICKPLYYTTRITERDVKLFVCLCWFFSVLYGGLIVSGDLNGPVHYYSCHGECLIIVDYIAGTVDVVVSFIIPVTIIIFLYIKVFVVAVSQARAMRSHITAASLQPSVNQSRKSELKAARTLGVLVLVFLICFCPYYCLSLIGKDALSSTPGAVVLCLFCFNSCVNPLIYALFYAWFKKTVKLIITLQIVKPGSCEARIL